jgi:hypothetical protein
LASHPVLGAESEGGIGEQVGHHGGVLLAGSRNQLRIIDQWYCPVKLPAGLATGGDGALVDLQGTLHSAGDRLRSQAGRIALHHRGTGEQRQTEAPDGVDLGLDGRIVGTDDAR